MTTSRIRSFSRAIVHRSVVRLSSWTWWLSSVPSGRRTPTRKRLGVPVTAWTSSSYLAAPAGCYKPSHTLRYSGVGAPDDRVVSKADSVAVRESESEWDCGGSGTVWFETLLSATASRGRTKASSSSSSRRSGAPREIGSSACPPRNPVAREAPAGTGCSSALRRYGIHQVRGEVD